MAKAPRVLLAVHPHFKPGRAKAGSTEYDVWRTLKNMGYPVEVIPLEESLAPLIAGLKDFKADLVFNLMEEFRGEAIFDFHIVSYLEANGIAYTGCNPRGLVLSRNKLWVSQLAQSLGLSVPEGGLHPSRRLNGRVQQAPLFVKFNREHASLGIDRRNRVTSRKELSSAVSRLRSKLDAEILIQEFIRGEEVTVSVWGNRRVEAFPPWQLRLGQEDRFATERIKFSSQHRRRLGVRSGRFRGEVIERLCRDSLRLFQFIDLSGYARFDYRISEDGTPYLIDVNPNPNLSRSEDFASSARYAGIDYPDVLKGIIDLGLKYKPRR